MKIVIIGYGKMGKEIERVAKERGHSVSAIFDVDRDICSEKDIKSLGDVAIEFTTPNTAESNVKACIGGGLPVVSGTTGWTFDKQDVDLRCRENKTSFFYSSNYSIGMNIFMLVNKILASKLSAYPQYSAKIAETHHIHKLDKPSGTAITLAKGIIEGNAKYNDWKLDAEAENCVEIDSYREGEVFGDHTICWESDFDTISITHSAKSRYALACGAVMAAEFIAGKSGFYSMEDLLNL
ncbi:MAG: 4-hydroxy-tetrahydrodipicolinate reductase [Bacteroidales bacterium]|nr:4-hydroxy-tetrahydrodipicolinate reductase [Bacteroidales bacterium]